MKPVSLLLVLFFMINGLVLAQESTNPADLIVGLWRAEDKTIYNFSEDKVLYVNAVQYATYRFAARTLYLTYIASGKEYEADVQFEDIRMTLTEYKNTTDEKTLILKKVPE
jgi:hypothetical protein